MMSPAASLSARSWDVLALVVATALVAVGGGAVSSRLAASRVNVAEVTAARALLARAQSAEPERLRDEALGAAADTSGAPERTSDVVRAVHAAAQVMAVDLVAMRPLPGGEGWRLHLEFEGRYHDIGYFLALLEGQPVTARVPSLRLTTVPRAPDARGPRRLRGVAEVAVSIPRVL